MKAITLWQPWASLVAIGAKRYETRSWQTSYRGRIAIHAAARPCEKLYLLEDDPYFEIDKAVIRTFHSDNYEFILPRGAIVATATLAGCYYIANAGDGASVVLQTPKDPMPYDEISLEDDEYLFGDWTEGRYAWELTDVQMLSKPIPCKGAQGLWNWEGAA